MQQAMIPEIHKHGNNSIWEISQWEQVRYRHFKQISDTTMMSQM